ncbi:MAG: hypothetical protein IKS37_08650 [Solobacterium sp.]|nr:hypothetical protein [Solobacterium sp.]
MKRTWRNMFRPHILERGEEYYEEGRVDILENNGRICTAAVYGTEDYEVTIDLCGGQVIGMECTCPYSCRGEYCKHMAAVLYSIEETEDAIDVGESIGHILSTDRIERRFDDLVSRNTYDGQTVPWQLTERFADGFLQIVDETMDPLLKAGNGEGAFMVMKKAFFVLEDVDLNEADEAGYELYWAMEDRFRHLRENASDTVRRELCAWISTLYDNREELVQADTIANLFLDGFADDAHKKVLYAEVLKQMDDAAERCCSLASLLEQYRSLLEEMKRDPKEYDDWLNAHEDEKEVLDIRLKEAEEAQDWQRARDILLKRYEQCASYEREETARHLSQVCRKTQDTEGAAHWLKETIRLSQSPNWQDLHDLKAICDPAEWETIRDDILHRFPYIKPQMYCEEGMYDELAASLEGCRISVADTYYSILKEARPAQLAKLYVRHLEQLQLRYPNKSLYEEMKKYVAMLAEIPGAKPLAEEFLQKWYIRYPTRKAMRTMIVEVNTQIHGSVLYMSAQ